MAEYLKTKPFKNKYNGSDSHEDDKYDFNNKGK